MVIAKIFGYLKVKTAARCSANDPEQAKTVDASIKQMSS